MKLESLIYSILQSNKKSYLIYAITTLLFILAVLTFPTKITKAKMLPSKDSDTFSVYVDLKEGSSIEQTKEVTSCIANVLQKNENITNISVFLGEGQPLDFAGLVKQSALKSKQSQAEMMINIRHANERSITSYNLVSQLRHEVKEQCSNENTTIKFIELPAGPPVLASIVAEIYGGKSFISQRAFSYQIAKILQNQATLVDIDVLASDDFITYELQIDQQKVNTAQVDLNHLKNILYMAYEGMNIAVINDSNAQRQIPVFIKLHNNEAFLNNSQQALQNQLEQLKIINQQSNAIAVSQLLSIKPTIYEPELTSKNLDLMINVIAETDKDSQIYPLLNARDEMIQTFSSNFEVIKTNMLNLAFINKQTQERFDVVFDGELKVTIDTFIDLGGAFIIALVLIFFLMVLYYKSFAISGGIVLASFISIIGVIIAHIIMDVFTQDTFYLTATSLIGYIGLIGINSRNSTLIIDFSKQLVVEKNYSINEAISKATATRSKPIILTVLTMVFASSLIANDAVFGGLGVALIGGTLISYVVSMFVVPVLLRNQLHKIV
jgi:multidrug efflux pump subunit AcrB